jgi:hypothetical protein
VLSLHHFAPDDAVMVLREVARVARRAWLVVDVERGFLPYLGALAMRILLRSPLTRHDAPATVLRAYTLAELKTLLARAGLQHARVTTQIPFRLVAYDLRAAPLAPSPTEEQHDGQSFAADAAPPLAAPEG